MNEYKYVVKDKLGIRHEGIRKAVCQNDVLMWARDNEFVPIMVEAVSLKKKKGVFRKHGRIASADIANFCWQLATMMKGGISITEALDTIADDMKNVKFSGIIRKIGEGIKGGESFSDRIAVFPETFDKLFYGMVLAGESSGSMPTVLHRLADYYDNRDKLIRKVRGAMTYPIFVVGFIFVIVTVMAVFIIPRFRSIFDTIGGRLPAFTETFLRVYDFMMRYAVYNLVILAVGITALVWYCRTEKGHYKLSRFTLSMPLFGQIILQAFVALFCRTTSTLLSAGVSVLNSLDILGAMSKNDVIKYAIFVAKDGIVKGSSISFSLTAAKLFPNLLLKMVRVGEQSGSLPDVLEKTADYYERRVEDAINTMTKMIEPILVISVGAIVLVVVIALYLPIFYLSDVKA
jgi:type IV pilus assembly protein PilC